MNDQPWPFHSLSFDKTVQLSPGLPAVDIVLLDLPTEPSKPAVCYACGRLGSRSVDPAAEPEACSVCGPASEIGGEL